jgi:hypothetical protein
MPAVEQQILENDVLRVIILPELGGKIFSFFHKGLQKEFLWTDPHQPVQILQPGSDYDSQFIGGIDELLPNDIPETIDGIDCPDHGELWTTQLRSTRLAADMLHLEGTLSVSGLHYEKTIRLAQDEAKLIMDYRITNRANETRHFLWKPHAALRIQAGDRVCTDARMARVVDPAYSRFPEQSADFQWPMIEATDVSVIPPQNGTMDFFYLFETVTGDMRLECLDGSSFIIQYDQQVFPFQWLFASYGGFLGHYTAILEPCTNMPIAVNDAITQNRSAILDSGETLQTRITLLAGQTENLQPL